MTRLPKKRGITQAEEDKSLILRHITYSVDNREGLSRVFAILAA